MADEQQDDRISHFIDAQGIADDKKIIIDALNEVLASIQKVDQIKLSLFGTNTISQALKVVQQLNDETKKLHTEQLRGVQILIAEEKARKLQTDQLLQEAKATKTLSEARLKDQQAQRIQNQQSRTPSGTSSSATGAFEQLRQAARDAKTEFNNLLADQEKGVQGLSAKIGFARQKWQDYQRQLQAIAITNKQVFSDSTRIALTDKIQAAKKELSTLQPLLDATRKKLLDLGKSSSGRGSDEFKLLTQQAAEYSVKIKQLEAELRRLSQAERERQLVASEAVKIQDTVDQEIAKGKQLTAFYDELIAKLNELQAEGRELAAKGLISGLSDAETKRLADIQVQASNLAVNIDKINNTLGRGARANHAYSQQLFSLQQVLRETPNIAFGWNIFLASLSNNIPILADDLKRLADRNKDLQAAGKPTASVMTQIGKSLMSLTSIIGIATAAITIISIKYGDYIVSLFRSAEANRKAFLASKEYLEILKLQEETVSKLTDAYNKLAEVTGKSNQNAVNGYKRELAALEALGVSADKLFGLKEEINKLDVEQSEKAFNLTGELLKNKAQADVVLAQKTVDKLRRDRDEAQKELDRLRAEDDEAEKRITTTDLQAAGDVKRDQKEKELVSKINILDESIRKQRTDGENAFRDLRLSNEEIITKKKEEAQEKLFNKSATLERQLNELRTDIELKKAKGEGAGLDKKEVEALKTRIGISYTQVQEAEKQFNNLQQVETEYFDAKADKEKLANEKTKFFSEQSRRIALSNIRQVTDETIAKNEQILANERSSRDQRLQAIDDIAEAKRKAAQGQRDFQLGNIGRSDADVVEAENEFTTQLLQIEIARSDQRIKIIDEFTERWLTSSETALRTEKEFTIRINDEISQSILASQEQRAQALAKSFQANQDILRQQTENQLKLAGLTEDEVSTFLAGNAIEVKDKKKTLEELLAIRLTYESNLRDMILKFRDDNLDNFIKELERQQMFIDESTKEIQLSLDETLLNRTRSIHDEINAIRELIKRGIGGLGELSKEQVELNRELELDRLRAIGDSIDKELKLYGNAASEKLQAEDRYIKAREVLSLALTDQQRERANKELAIAKQIYDDKVEKLKSVIALQNQLEENTQNIRNTEDQFRTEDLQTELQMWEMRFQLVSQIEDFAMTVMENNHQRRMEMLEEEQDQLEKKADKERSLIEQAVLNEDEKQRRLRELEIRTQNQQETLDARRRRLERDRAIQERNANIAKVLAEQFMAIARVQFQAAIYASNPLTAALVPIALAQIPYIILQAGLAIGAIASQPLPKLAHGTDDSKAGLHIMGEAGKKELVQEPSGKMWVTGNKAGIYDLTAHSVVYPDADKAINDMMAMARQKTDDLIVMSYPKTDGMPEIGKLDDTMKNGFTLLQKTIKDKPEFVFERDMNKDLLLRYGANYWKYIN